MSLADSLTNARSAVELSKDGTDWSGFPGAGVTLACNVGYGVAYGAVGALISAWPAAGFLVAFELLTLLVRRSACQPARHLPRWQRTRRRRPGRRCRRASRRATR